MHILKSKLSLLQTAYSLVLCFYPDIQALHVFGLLSFIHLHFGFLLIYQKVYLKEGENIFLLPKELGTEPEADIANLEFL